MNTTFRIRMPRGEVRALATACRNALAVLLAGVAVSGYAEEPQRVVFDPLADGFVDWPYDQYRRLRAEDPIHRSDLLHGFCVTRFADVNAILRDPTV